jgi:lambda family phage tail tape measure protein
MLEHIKQHLTLHYLSSMRSYVKTAAGGEDAFKLNEERQLDSEAQHALSMAAQLVSQDSEQVFKPISPILQQMMQQMEQASQSQAQQMLMSDPTSNALLQTQMAETKRKGEEAQARFTLEREKLQAEMADKVRDMQAKLAEIQSKMGLEQSLSDQDNAAKIAKMYNDNPGVKDKLAGDARSRVLFTKEPIASGETANAEDNPEVKARKAQVTLARQLRAIDADRNKVNAEAVFLGETLTKIALLDLSLKEKLAQIEAKRAGDLFAARENTPAFRAQINALADQEVLTAQANTKAQKELATATAQRAHALEQSSQSFRAIEHAQYEAASKAAEANSEERTAALYQMGKMADEQVRVNQLANERTEYEMKLLRVAPAKRQMLMEQYDLEARITEFVREQNRLGQDPAMIKQRADAMREAGIQTINLSIATQDAQRTFEYGWAQAYNNFVDQSTNAAARAGEIFNSITNNMSSAIDTFVRTGKLSFKDFTRSVIQDLIAIQMKAQAMSLFRMALGSFGFTAGASSPMAYGGGIPGAYADGGNPPVGVPSLVGERGPELFVPKSAGTIIPNNQLSSVMGGGQTVNYNGPFIAQMNAIDTQSGIQFLSKNKQAVWAANQSAQRSLPMSK